MRRGGGGWVGRPRLQATKVLNPRRLRRRRGGMRRRRCGVLLLMGVGGQHGGGGGGRSSASVSPIIPPAASSSSRDRLLGVDAERGDGLGAGADGLLLLLPDSSPFPLLRGGVRRRQLPAPLTHLSFSTPPLREVVRFTADGVLRRALLQEEAGGGWLRPLLDQRGGDGGRDGVHHLDPPDGDHRERRTHLSEKKETNTSSQNV